MDTLDSLQTRAPEQRERELMARLPHLIARAKAAAGWSHILKDIDPARIDSRAALATLPVTRKSDLHALQQRQPPFGGLNTTPVGRLSHVFMSPGPIFDPQGRGEDWWRFARPLHAAGVRAGGLLQNCFTYHFTPAAFMVEGGAARLGCAVIPAGSGQTELQVQAIHALRPDTYAGTPSFLKIIIEKAREMGVDISSIQRALVSAEALPESLRAWFGEHGVPCVLQVYASADIGNIAYETRSGEVRDPGLVLDEEVILEIVRPGSGEPVPAGEVGEVVVTLFNPDYPLIRFATGDLSAILADAPQCAHSNTRIRGWLGRADQTTKIRGMFVHPSQVHDIARRHPEIVKARLVVSGRIADEIMTLHCEVADPARANSTSGAAIVDSVRKLTKLRGEVQFVAIGSLPNDGKVIADVRDYQ